MTCPYRYRSTSVPSLSRIERGGLTCGVEICRNTIAKHAIVDIRASDTFAAIELAVGEDDKHMMRTFEGFRYARKYIEDEQAHNQHYQHHLAVRLAD